MERAAERRQIGTEKRHAVEMAGIREGLDRNTRSIGKLFLLQEGQGKEITEIKAKMAGFKAPLDSLHRLHREGMEVHGKQVAALCDRMGSLERKVDGMETKVDRIEGDLADLKAEFAAFREAVAPRATPFGTAPFGAAP